MSKKIAGIILVVLVVTALAAATWLQIDYRQEMHAARDLISAGRTIDTALGSVEYAESGDGLPILVIHGAAGGFDQGLLLGRQFVPAGYRVIAPSRFGYLNAAIPQDNSLEAQADAYAALLDALDIKDPLPVIAFSAGGPSALTFAMRHPDRASALVMLSAVSYADPPGSESRSALEAAINRLVSSDFVYWLSIKFAAPKVAALLGIPPSTQERLLPADWEEVNEVFTSMLPMSERLPGIAVDQSRDFPLDMPLQQITMPTLVMHAQDDVLVPFANGEHTAQTIDGAQLVPVDYGGHFFAGHSEEVRANVGEFLRQATVY